MPRTEESPADAGDVRISRTQMMTKLETAVRRAAGDILERFPFLSMLSTEERNLRLTSVFFKDRSIISGVQSILSQDPSFGDLHSGWVMAGSIGLRIQEWQLSACLVRCQIEGYDIAALIASAQKLAASRECVIETYKPLAGVAVANRVLLSSGVVLLPWEMVPNGRRKSHFESPDFLFRYGEVTAALQFRTSQRALFSSPAEEGAMESNGQPFEHEYTSTVLNCITTMGHPCVLVGRWDETDNMFLNEFASGGYSVTANQYDRVFFAAPRMLDENPLRDLIVKYQGFNPSQKATLNIGINRLARAVRNTRPVDRAIDLGVALEVILLHGLGKGDRGELRFRMGIRGAAFLGNEKTERLRVLHVLKSVYDLRSEAVHTGSIGKRQKGDPKEMLQEGINICAKIMQKLIILGEFPDWDSEYVVGGT